MIHPFQHLTNNPGLMQDNISIPIIASYVGMQATLFIIPIVLLEWAVAILLFKYLYKVQIKISKLLIATFDSNLFSSLVGAFIVFFLFAGGASLESNRFTDDYIMSLVTMMVLSILLELPVVFLMLRRYLKDAKKNIGEKELVSVDRSMIFSYSLITCILQNIVTYSISLLIVISFGFK